MSSSKMVVATTTLRPKVGDSLTPNTDKIKKDLVRIIADVLDFGYDTSGTWVEKTFICARKTKKGKVKVELCPRNT